MKCSKCGSESYRIRNYDPYTNRFIYECSHCGSVIDCFNNETIYTNKSINTNKSIEINKPYDTCSVNNTLQSCPNCGSSMMLQTNGDFICSKCGLIYSINTSPANKDITNHNDYYVNYDEIYKNNQIQGNSTK